MVYNATMKQYLDLLQDIRTNGIGKDDRTGTGTISVFGRQMRFDLNAGFPAVTTKKLYTNSLIHELLWFLQGNTNIQYLAKNNVHIWDDWPYAAYKKSTEYQGESIKEFSARIAEDDTFAQQWGELGPVYGKQWRRWEGKNGQKIDQIANVISELKTNPTSRRLVVSGWNVADLQELIQAQESAPPLCHTMFQFYVIEGRLSCQLYQRSADLFLGVPFNIASYSLLTMMIAQVAGLGLGDFIHTFGDAHIYRNHFEQVDKQLSREPKPLPRMKINSAITSIDDFTFDDFELVDYRSWPSIKAPIAV